MSDSLRPRDCSPPGSSVHGVIPGKNTGVGSHSLLQGIFLTQGSNPNLLHWQVDSLPLSHRGSPQLGWESNSSPTSAKFSGHQVHFLKGSENTSCGWRWEGQARQGGQGGQRLWRGAMLDGKVRLCGQAAVESTLSLPLPSSVRPWPWGR